jgi:transglutaminase-like putative cysteine protease
MVSTARSSVAAALLFATSLLLVLGDTPPWCVGIGLAAVLWRIGIATGRITPPRRIRGVKFLLGAITALLALAVAASFQTLNGLGAGTALLVVMGALKLLESHTRRDDAIVIGVALFLLLAAALAGQGLWRLPLYLLTLWGAGAAIALVAHGDGLFTTRAAFRIAARALAMSIPLALLCFAFFPRVAGQFWALQRGAGATTGLSDEMTPGSIDKLATEYDPAFRVRFAGAPPPQTALYWRGPVLNTFDGLTWRRAPSGRGLYVATPTTTVGDAVRYRVTLEPTNRYWVFTLDTVDASPRRDFYLSHDRQLTAANPITSVISYDAVSHLETRSDGPLSALGRRFETRMHPGRNPRTRMLALEIRARTGSDADYARAVLEWFRTNGLEYTLEPGATDGDDSVDTTLFETKRGFCGHFASAYASMMRAAGVPARVVTGYLGGEWNPVGGYLIVRQAEAHAWTEIWLDGRGWTRVDPTAVVAPERLQRGVYDFMADSLPATSVFLHNNRWISGVMHLWDGANQWWQENVVEFNLRSQFELLRNLGIESPQWQHLGWAFALGLAAWIAWVALSLRRSLARGKPDRIGRAWLRATRKLARVAAPRAANEGPLDFARRIAESRPDLATSVEKLATRYARLRFGAAANQEEIAGFEREVRRLAV